MAAARPTASSRRASGGRGLVVSGSDDSLGRKGRRLRVRYGPTTTVLVPVATSFSGSASWARRCSPGVRGSATSSLLVHLVRLFEQLDGMPGHDGRYRVLVDELRMAVPAQQHAEVIEPSDHPLELDAVHEKDRERNFILPDMVEKGVLKVLRAIARHRSCLASPRRRSWLSGRQYGWSARVCEWVTGLYITERTLPLRKGSSRACAAIRSNFPPIAGISHQFPKISAFGAV